MPWIPTPDAERPIHRVPSGFPGPGGIGFAPFAQPELGGYHHGLRHLTTIVQRPRGVGYADWPVATPKTRHGRMLSAARANAAMLHWQVVTSGVVERCHAVDAPVFAWTVLDAGEVRRLDELGVDGVIVDDPRIFEG